MPRRGKAWCIRIVGWVDHIANMIVAGGVLFGIFQQWRNGKAIKEVHIATNSMHDEIVDLTRKEATLTERAASVAAAAADAEKRTDT
jgi:hypothetical protein